MRNPPGPTGPRRPDLDWELSRCHDVLVAAGAVTGHLSLDLDRLARSLADHLSSQPARVNESDPLECTATNRTAVCATVSALVHRQANEALESAEAELARITGARRPLRGERRQLAALRAAGLDVASLDPRDLAPHRRKLVVRALERVRRLERLERHLRVELHRELVRAWDEAPRRPRAESLEQLGGRGTDGRYLLEALVRFEAGRHLNLIRHQANKLAGSYAGYCAEDLFGWGYRGLLAALHGYDPSQWAFSTYGCTRIVGAIQDGVRQESPIPKRLGTYARQVRSVQARLGQELGREPSPDEVARTIALERLERELGRRPTVAELADRIEAEQRAMTMLPRLGTPASLDELVAAGAHPLPLVEDPADEAVVTLARQAVRDAIAQLPPDEAQAVTLLDLEGLTLEQAGQRTGATTRQLRSRRDRGRRHLADTLSHWA